MRLAKIAKKWCPERRKFVFDIEFRVLPAITERTVAVAEAFGLGVDRARAGLLGRETAAGSCREAGVRSLSAGIGGTWTPCGTLRGPT